MNITLQTNKLNSTAQYNYKNNQYNKCKPAPQSFTGYRNESAITKPFEKFYRKCCIASAKYITVPLLNSKTFQTTAGKLKDNKLIFNHMQAVGSLITSGMYAVSTLKNKELDKDKKNTLAINQVLTFIISTAGMYAIDGALNSWWDGVSAKYAGKMLDKADLFDKFKEANKAIKDNNLALIAEHGKEKAKDLLKKSSSVEKFVAKHYGEEGKALSKQLIGMDLLKRMAIIGLVYRYVVPVLVVPIANKLGEKHLAAKKAKAAQTTQATQTVPTTEKQAPKA